MQAEYDAFHQHLMNLVDKMPEKYDLRTKNDEESRRKIEKFNQLITETLGQQGLKLYLHAKPPKLEGVSEISGPRRAPAERIDLIVKELNIAKLLRNPEKMERLIIVNENDNSLKFLKRKTEVSEDVEINLKLKPPPTGLPGGDTIGQNLHARAIDAQDMHILNLAMEQVIQEIQTAVEAQPAKITEKPTTASQQAATQKTVTKAPVPTERREEFTPASERKEYVPPVKDTDKAEVQAEQQRKALERAGEKKRERFRRYEEEVQEHKREHHQDLTSSYRTKSDVGKNVIKK